jgi:DNA-binding NtrC family response regulator
MYSEDMATILLVDDDPLHAAVRKAILDRKYPDVRRVSDAAEALSLIEQPQFARNLAMVVSSNLNSGIGMASFVSELHLRVPDIPILVIGEKRAIGGDFSDYPVMFLKRPVTADDLLSAVCKTLASWTHGRLKTA